MGDEDEVMRFEITDQDLQDEMSSSYGRRRMSKNKAIYGVWADNSDSEEETSARPSFGGKRDFSAPVSFVSAGVQNQKKKQDNTEDVREAVKDDSGGSSDDDEAPRRTGFGGGGYRGRAGRVESEGQIAGMRSQNYSQP